MVAAGGFAYDDCCVGLLLAAPERIYRTTAPFPVEAGPDGACGDLIAVDVVVILGRCVPVIDNRGDAPPNNDQEAAMKLILEDAAVVWQAVTSKAMVSSDPDDAWGDDTFERAAVSQVFSGPEGGCMLVETRLTVGVSSTDWCLPCPPVEAP